MKYDQHENCAKCGYPGKTVEYRHHMDQHGPQVIYQSDDLLLTCSRCGYRWFRDCLDKEEANG
ncbi:hypothetical protein KDX40_04820 [Burkholderia ambifaria]|uniref:hypothetical protein n=1 Tax=Burkholderia ambifaria TaxID=152480 RepID=UPI001BA1B6E8|nr:hypothetical protein [Burkholderia ambifaria]MBR8343060.1 hypothetical protein [Burkholderia ambifaria]